MQGHALDHMFTHLRGSKRPHDPGLSLFHILTVESTKSLSVCKSLGSSYLAWHYFNEEKRQQPGCKWIERNGSYGWLGICIYIYIGIYYINISWIPGPDSIDGYAPVSWPRQNQSKSSHHPPSEPQTLPVSPLEEYQNVGLHQLLEDAWRKVVINCSPPRTLH